MPTLVRNPQPLEFEQLLERRRRLGLDRFDEVLARELADRRAGPEVFVDLAPVRDPARVVRAVGEVLSLPEAPGAVVATSCERLHGSASHRLHATGERVWPVAPLGVPERRAAAVHARKG